MTSLVYFYDFPFIEARAEDNQNVFEIQRTYRRCMWTTTEKGGETEYGSALSSRIPRLSTLPRWYFWMVDAMDLYELFTV